MPRPPRGAHPWEWRTQDGLRAMPVRSRVTVNNAEACIACCLAGLGLIQIPAYDVRSHLEAGELIEVMPRFRPAPMPIALLYPHRQHLLAPAPGLRRLAAGADERPPAALSFGAIGLRHRWPAWRG